MGCQLSRVLAKVVETFCLARLLFGNDGCVIPDDDLAEPRFVVESAVGRSWASCNALRQQHRFGDADKLVRIGASSHRYGSVLRDGPPVRFCEKEPLEEPLVCSCSC